MALRLRNLDQKGIGILEAMVALGIIAVISLVLIDSIVSSKKSVTRVIASQDSILAVIEIGQQLQKSAPCTEAITAYDNFLADNVANSDVKIKRGGAALIPWTGKYGALNISRVFIDEVVLVTSSAASNSYQGKIKFSGNAEGMQLQDRSVGMIYFSRDNSTSKITGCSMQVAAASTTEGEWVNVADPNTTHDAACATVGLKAFVSFEIGGCASGEGQPRMGKNAQYINYIHGKWGGFNMGGNLIVQTPYCYNPGQKQDGDGTDLVVAYFCKADNTGSYVVK